MKNFERGLKRKVLNEDAYNEDVANAPTQPFKKASLMNNEAQHLHTDRIDAHRLFSYYTADIIKEETIFTR